MRDLTKLLQKVATKLYNEGTVIFEQDVYIFETGDCFKFRVEREYVNDMLTKNGAEILAEEKREKRIMDVMGE